MLCLQAILSRTAPEDFHSVTEDSSRHDLFKHSSHAKPNLRIFENGHGREALRDETTSIITRPDGQVLCSKYTLTSAGYISKKDLARPLADMDCVTLDIGQDLSEQGFETREHDVLHATADSSASLVNLKKLLHAIRRMQVVASSICCIVLICPVIVLNIFRRTLRHRNFTFVVYMILHSRT